MAYMNRTELQQSGRPASNRPAKDPELLPVVYQIERNSLSLGLSRRRDQSFQSGRRDPGVVAEPTERQNGEARKKEDERDLHGVTDAIPE